MNRRFAIQLWIPLALLSLSAVANAQTTNVQTANTAVINNERVNIRSGPGEQFNRFILLDKETKVTELNRQNGWSQIRLSNGKVGWLHDRYLRYLNPQKPAVPAATVPSAAKTVPPQPKPTPEAKHETKREVRRDPSRERKHAPVQAAPIVVNPTAKPVVQAPVSKAVPQVVVKTQPQQPAVVAAKPVNSAEPQGTIRTPGTVGNKAVVGDSSPKVAAPITAAAKPGVSAAKPSEPTTQKPNDPNAISGLLVDTKKDPFASGAGVGVGVGDAFRLLLYLLPVLGLVVLAVRGLKRFQEKTGKLPSFKGSILGGFNLSNSRQNGGSNIRVVESVPVGGMELHVVEVRGRMLLLSSSGQSVTLLTELSDGENGESEFQSLLGGLTNGDVDDDDLDSTIGVTVGSLDDSLRETREAIVRSAQRTLNQRASEASEDEGNIDDQLFGRRKAGARR